jgi:hypothetical protein
MSQIFRIAALAGVVAASSICATQAAEREQVRMVINLVAGSPYVRVCCVDRHRGRSVTQWNLLCVHSPDDSRRGSTLASLMLALCPTYSDGRAAYVPAGAVAPSRMFGTVHFRRRRMCCRARRRAQGNQSRDLRQDAVP